MYIKFLGELKNDWRIFLQDYDYLHFRVRLDCLSLMKHKQYFIYIMAASFTDGEQSHTIVSSAMACTGVELTDRYGDIHWLHM